MNKEKQQKLENWIRENSKQEEDNLIFEEQDSTTLASNIMLFLKAILEENK